MHVHRKAWRNVTNVVCAAALVTFAALPLSIPLATPTSAQTTGSPSAVVPAGCTPSTTTSFGTCIADAHLSNGAAVAFNPVGVEDTATFVCDRGVATSALTGTGTTGAAALTPGCYDVTATVSDATTGSTAPIVAATCNNVAAAPSGGNVDCSGVASPICPVTTAPTGVTATPCATAVGTSVTSPVTGYTTANTATVTINPGTNHTYLITFTGYVPTTALGSCPAGTTGPITTDLTTSVGTPPVSTVTAAPGGACRFSVSVQKKYVEITNVILTTPKTCGGNIIFAEGLKTFFGPACPVTAVATGTVVLKTGVNCANEPPTGTDASNPINGIVTDFPVGSTYRCENGTLSVENVPVPGVLLTFTATGAGSFTSVGSLGGFCAGAAGAQTNTAPSGSIINVCPTGPGPVTISACYVSTLNTQPPICSGSVTFAFTQNIGRVVPYVRWAGEKIVLTKCFGVGLSGAPVEFTLKGNNPGLNATLIPIGANAGAVIGTTSTGTTGATVIGTVATFPTADTVWTRTDPNGCASVIGYADGEGVMYVDAAIFSTTTAVPNGVGPIVNEHAFEVFYLKFDHVDLENLTFQTYATAQAIAPYLSFQQTATLGGASVYPTSFTIPGPPGSGHVAGTPDLVPICQIQYVRAMVHGYFEMPGDPSGRPASTVAVPNAPAGSAGSYVLPAGRWVLPEDWPLLATFAGFSSTGAPFDVTPSSVMAWDLNSGWVFNPTNENPVFCIGNGLLPVTNINSGGVPMGDVELGPCVSKDANGTVYDTAPGLPGVPSICAAGDTVGIGPFDATQSCTDPFPLKYTPAGASVIGTTAGMCGTTPIPCLASTGPNSTYLPNATLNQWDAPMPPAQVSFGITSGPGFLDEVNKTGLYNTVFDLGPAATGTTCPTGYVPALPGAAAGTTFTLASGQVVKAGDCILSVDPNPFYAEAIPASPLIPPVTNNGGYLWNSWNFSAGVTTVIRSTPAFASPAGFAANTNPPPGGFVSGQSTTATVAGTSVPGGTELTCSAGVAGGASTAVVVADARGFGVGDTVEVIPRTGGGPALATGATITAILPNTAAASNPGTPYAAELQFDMAVPCAPSTAATPSPDVIIGTDIGLPVPGAAAFSIGQTITITPPGGASTTATIIALDTTDNIVYVSGAEGLAAFYGCAGGLSRPGGPAGNPTCEPNLLLPPGTVITSFAAGATAPITIEPPNPYPFWQWISALPTATNLPTSASMYSDNHGEAVVSLSTNIATQILPVNGTCPSPYVGFSFSGTIIACQLPFQALGALGFQNVASALSAFSAAKPGCIATFPSGTTAPVPGATIGPHGPAAGQICINALGGIEFGAAATLGSTTVQAAADYPYTREHEAIASAPLQKVFTSAFAKDVTVSAGTPGPAGTTSYTVTVTAQDVCGNALIGEPVQVYALGNAGAAVLAPVKYGVLVSASTTSSVLTVQPSTGQAVLSLEVLNTAIGTQGLVVKAVFPLESIERFATVIAGTTPGATANVVYAPGWQQVGGPPGSNFSVAEALFSWDAGAQAYTNATASAGNISSAAPGCTGYWAYFAAAMAVGLPATSKAGDTATCTLVAGWNLVGNPFASPAKLPSGVTAYHWNGTSYDTVGLIPTGGSVWVYNDGTLNSLTLTAT